MAFFSDIGLGFVEDAWDEVNEGVIQPVLGVAEEVTGFDISSDSQAGDTERGPTRQEASEFAQAFANQLTGTTSPAVETLGQASMMAGATRGSQSYEQQQRARQQQLGAYDLLYGAATGKAPSVAEQQLRQGQRQAMQDSMALAASSRSNPQAAARAAIGANARAQAEASAQASMLRAQEQAAARNALMGAASQIRASDQQSVGQAQQLQLGAASSALDAQQARAGIAADVYAQAMSGDTQRALAREQARAQKQANTLSAIGQGIQAASDKRLKTNVRQGDELASAFLDSLSSKLYSYKDSPNVDKLGVMAQDMEKSRLGKQAVTKDAHGMRFIDTEDATSALLAAVANLHGRLKKVEK